MYSLRQVSKLLGLKESSVKALARSGLLEAGCQGHSDWVFSFRDLVLLRAARGLMQSRMSAGRVQKILGKLKEQLDGDRPLSSIQIRSHGNRVTVQDEQRVWDAETGQHFFNFQERAGTKSPIHLESSSPGGESASAEEWYELACGLDSDSLYEAASAYRKALELDPRHKDAHVNLGRILHEMGEFSAAEKHYREALEVDPGDPTSAYNLGVVLEDLGRAEEAVEAYDKAVTLSPGFKEAHYNLARLYELEGQHEAALRHLREYRQLD